MNRVLIGIFVYLVLVIPLSLHGFIIDSEFQTESDIVIDGEDTPPVPGVFPAIVYSSWISAGSNAIIDSLVTINVLEIPDDVTYDFGGVYVPIPEAQSGEGFDNSLTFNKLIKWINTNVDSVLVHTQIYIPPGIYNFSDQIIMHSNISFKGAGSHLTTLRFLIRADSTSTTMSKADCRKDAILISGSDDAYKYNCGIEDLKIERIRNGISEGEVKDRVGGHTYKV